MSFHGKALGIPFGPRDAERLEIFEAEYVPQLLEIGWRPAIELKTDRISEDQEWVQQAVAFCDRHGAALNWHANDRFFSRLGAGLTAQEAVEYISKADWLVENHGCRIVMHFGTHNWPSFDRDTPEPILPPLDARRFQCPIGAEEYLAQMNGHIEVIDAIVKHFGDPKVILGENTHISLTGIAQYNAMQCGTAQFVTWLAEVTGISTLLDIEHYWELVWLLNREGSAKWLGEPEIIDSPTDAQLEVVEMTGMMIEKGKIPYATVNFRDFEATISAMLPECFHVGATPGIRWMSGAHSTLTYPLTLRRRRQMLASTASSHGSTPTAG